MMRLVATLFAAVCVSTLLVLVVGLGYLWKSQRLTRDKVVRLAAVMYDLDQKEAKAPADGDQAQPAPAQKSLAEQEVQRKIANRDLELKQQALEKSREEIRFQLERLQEEKSRFDMLRAGFETKLSELAGETATRGYANLRATLELMAPKQAKNHLLKMVEQNELKDVVIVMNEMPIDKRRKIIKEFSSPQETDVMDRVLREMRSGGAETALLDETAKEVKTGNP